MEPSRFWRTTPVQLSLLSAVHSEINNPEAFKPRVARTLEEAGIDI